jgi:hypothetical protein
MDTEDFRGRLILAFPPHPFHGLVSTHDECDDGIALRTGLPGKRWDEVPGGFVDANSLSLPLLEPRALVAFLPAWLLRAAQTFHPNSPALEFLVYFLCPGSEDEGWNEEHLTENVALFDEAQRQVVADFLQSVLDTGELGCHHSCAEHALPSWRS